MLQLSSAFLSQPVVSLRTGGEVAGITGVIVNPNNLKIEGFYCDDGYVKTPLVLLTQDIRTILPQGYAVNDHEVLTPASELVRLQDLIKMNFQLVGKQVVTVEKHKIGKINDWAADTNTFYIQKLYVSQSILKSINNGQLSIDRTQIVEITSKKIIIQEILKGHPLPAGAVVT